MAQICHSFVSDCVKSVTACTESESECADMETGYVDQVRAILECVILVNSDCVKMVNCDFRLHGFGKTLSECMDSVKLECMKTVKYVFRMHENGKNIPLLSLTGGVLPIWSLAKYKDKIQSPL